MKDLVLLVADNNTQFALKAALERPDALGIRPIQFEFRAHPGRDGGTRKTGPNALVLERRRFQHGWSVFDFEGCGSDLPDAVTLENEMDLRLKNHWNDKAKAIVINPELVVWMGLRQCN